MLHILAIVLSQIAHASVFCLKWMPNIYFQQGYLLEIALIWFIIGGLLYHLEKIFFTCSWKQIFVFIWLEYQYYTLFLSVNYKGIKAKYDENYK